jgi:hypothetical protein
MVHAGTRLDERNGTAHDVYKQSQVLCGWFQDVREPRPTKVLSFAHSPYNCTTALLEISFCRTMKTNNNTPITIFVHQLFKVPLKLINV